MRKYLLKTIAISMITLLTALSCQKSYKNPEPEPTTPTVCSLTTTDGSLFSDGTVAITPTASLLITKGEDVEYTATYQIDNSSMIHLTGLFLNTTRKLDLSSYTSKGTHTITGYVCHELDTCKFSGNYTMTTYASSDTVIYNVPEVHLTVTDTIPASGGTVSSGSLSYKQTVKIIKNGTTRDSIITSGGEIVYGDPVTAPACISSISGLRLVDSLRVSITMNGKTGHGADAVWQRTGGSQAVYDDPVVTLIVQDTIPAEGGTISKGEVSYYQKCTITREAGKKDTIITTGGYITWGPAVTASACGAQAESVRLVDSLRVTVTMNGKSGSAAAAVWQRTGNDKRTYYDPVVTVTVKDSIPAAGGTISSGEVTYSQKCTITRTTGTKDTILTTGGLIEWSEPVSAGYLGTTEQKAQKRGTLTATVTMNGKSGSASADVWQQANIRTYEYDNPVVTLTVKDTIPASGGSVSSGDVTYSQTEHQNYTSGASEKQTLTTGGSLKWSDKVTAGSLKTTECAASKVGTLTVTVTMNGKSGNASADVWQAANTCIRTYDIPAISLKITDIIPASGGTVSSGNVTYSQTEHQSYTSGSYATVTLTTGGEIQWGSPVSAQSLGTTVKDKSKVGSLSVSVTMNNKKNTTSANVYQEANKAESLEITPSSATLRIGDSQSLYTSAIYTSGNKKTVSATYSTSSSLATISSNTVTAIRCYNDGTDIVVNATALGLNKTMSITILPIYVSLIYNGPDELYIGESEEYNVKCQVRRSSSGSVEVDDVTSDTTTSFAKGGMLQTGNGHIFTISGQTGTETVTFTYAKGNLTTTANIRVRSKY